MAPPEVWGPPVWNFIHTLAEKVNEDSFNSVKVGLFSIIKRICLNLPCPECSQHANQFFMRVNISKIHNKSEFKHMLYVFHNAVNKRKRKAIPIFTNIIDRYKYMSIPNTYNNFISVYNTKGNLSLIMQSFQRSLVIKDLHKWLQANYLHFRSKKVQHLDNKPIINNGPIIEHETDNDTDSDCIFENIIITEKFNIDEIIHEPIPEPDSEPLPEPVTEVIPESVSEVVPEPITEVVPEPVNEPINEPIFESFTEVISEPESVSDPVPESVSEPLPEQITELVTESISQEVSDILNEIINEIDNKVVTEPIQENFRAITEEDFESTNDENLDEIIKTALEIIKLQKK